MEDARMRARLSFSIDSGYLREDKKGEKGGESAGVVCQNLDSTLCFSSVHSPRLGKVRTRRNDSVVDSGGGMLQVTRNNSRESQIVRREGGASKWTDLDQENTYEIVLRQS